MHRVCPSVPPADMVCPCKEGIALTAAIGQQARCRCQSQCFNRKEGLHLLMSECHGIQNQTCADDRPTEKPPPGERCPFKTT